MPVFLTRYRDGDFSLTVADTREQAQEHFKGIACVDLENIHELQHPHLTLSFTLDQKGNSTFSHYDGVIEEARRVCYPRLIEALGGLHPNHISDPAHVAKIDRIVDQELKLRRRPKRLARQVPPAPASRPRT